VHFVLAEQVQHRLVDEHDPAELLGQRWGRPPALPALVLEGVALQQGRERHIQTLQGERQLHSRPILGVFLARAEPF